NYRLLEGKGPVRLKLQPSVHFRGHDDPVSEMHGAPYVLTAIEDRYELRAGHNLPTLRLWIDGAAAAFTLRGETFPDILYRVEERRGYDHTGSVWSPGNFRVELATEHEATLVASTEKWETVHALPPAAALAAERERRRRLVLAAVPSARKGLGAELVLAADQ